MGTEQKSAETKSSFLIPQEKYLETGIHIGTRFKTIDMKPYIFKMRDDGLFILDLRKIDDRVRMAAKIMSKYKPEDVVVVASRLYSANAAEKFCALTGVTLLRGRFVPGTMTNIKLPVFREPKLLIICDPKGEWEAIREASMTGVPVIGLCDTDNNTAYIDWVVPSNNKGRKSLAALFYLFTRELLMSQGKITSYDQFEYRVDHFERFEEGQVPTLKERVEAETEPEAAPSPQDLVEDERAKKALEDAKAEETKAEAPAPRKEKRKKSE